MRRTICILIILIIAAGVYAFDVEYSVTSDTDIDTIVRQKDDLLKKLDKQDEKALLEKYRDKKAKHSAHKHRLTNKFPTMKIEEKQDKIKYHKNVSLQGIPREQNVRKYKTIAADFLQVSFPEVLGNDEDIKIMHVQEEYGAQQEKCDDGTISPEVNVKSYAYTVRIGRTIYNQPIFDSFATVEIDAASDEIISFGLTNWKPISGVQKEKMKKIKKSAITGIINNRLDEQKTPQNKNVKKVIVTKIIQGWIFNDISDDIVPVFVHYGDVEEVDNNGIFVNKQYSFLEVLDPGINENVKIDPDTPSLILEDTTEEKEPEPEYDVIKNK